MHNLQRSPPWQMCKGKLAALRYETYTHTTPSEEMRPRRHRRCTIPQVTRTPPRASAWI